MILKLGTTTGTRAFTQIYQRAFYERVGRHVQTVMELTERPVLIKDVTSKDVNAVHLKVELVVDG